MMYRGDSRPDDQDTDAAMTALYRELDQRDLPSDSAFDIETGLRDLTSRMHRETSRAPEPALTEQREHLPAHAGTVADPSRRDAQAENELTRLYHSHEIELARIGRSHELELARMEHSLEIELSARSSRASTVFFAGISGMAVIATALVAFPHLASFAAIIAIAVINATAAAAGTLVYRTSVLARRTVDAVRRHVGASSDPAGPGGHSPAADTITNDAPHADPRCNVVRVHIEQFNGGTLTLADSQRPPGGVPRMPHHRAVTAVLAVLTVATAVAAVIGIVGMVNQGPLSGYEITLITPTATSILLLLTTWWWRTTDHSPPSPPPAPTATINRSESALQREDPP